jgi:hypothetical protein
MNLNSIYLKPESKFSKYVLDWASTMGIETVDYDAKSEEFPEGLLLINANQDIEKEADELHVLFDKKHIPTQKIDLNGTLQVAVKNLEMWLNNYKCKNVLILGADDLVANENLDRFFSRIKNA